MMMEMSSNYLIETLLFISIALSISAIFSIYSCLVYSFVNLKKIRRQILIPCLLGVIFLNLSIIYLVSNYPYAWALNKFYIIGLPASFCALFFSRDYILKKLSELNSQEKIISRIYDFTTYFIGGSVLSYMIMMSRMK
jgi:hypothetical protein